MFHPWLIEAQRIIVFSIIASLVFPDLSRLRSLPLAPGRGRFRRVGNCAVSLSSALAWLRGIDRVPANRTHLHRHQSGVFLDFPGHFFALRRRHRRPEVPQNSFQGEGTPCDVAPRLVRAPDRGGVARFPPGLQRRDAKNGSLRCGILLSADDCVDDGFSHSPRSWQSPA